jgi:hypothetical protein
MQIGIDEFQRGVCLTEFHCPLGYPLIQRLVGGVQFLVGHLKFFGEHGSFFQRCPQISCRGVIPQRIGNKPGHF